MKPVGILQFSPTVPAGYFATFLERVSIPYRLHRIDAGDPVPAHDQAYAGWCLLGGPMSVNDPLPWIPAVLELVRHAVAAHTPVIGHCLGGQLMARALGGAVTRNPVKEIGWCTVTTQPTPEARAWLGDLPAFRTFQWHGDTFSLPPGAHALLTSPDCANQAFSLGPHLGMQCHVEVTPEIIATWNLDWENEVAGQGALPASIQTPAQMAAELATSLAAMRDVADRLYARWAENLVRDANA